MIRRTGRDTARKRQPRAHLQVERLEDRSLLDAAPLAWTALMPNDPSFTSQYGLNNTGQTGGKADADIDAPEAWNVSTGSLANIVAVVDTGVDYRHIDLYTNIWINQAEIPAAIKSNLADTDGDGLITFWDLNSTRNQGAGKIIDVNKNGRIDGGDLLAGTSQGGWADGKDTDSEGHIDDLIGWDFLNNDNNPYDDDGHGTHVAGIIGAIGDNGTGITGVNWQVRIMPLKFLGGDGSGSVAGAVSAINYAVAHRALASNHSWSMGTSYWQPLYDAMNRARQAGHIIVAAAGNGGSDSKGDNNDATPNYPSNFGLDNILAVAAMNSSDVLTAYSNYGAKSVDLGAPGTGILSTYPGDRYYSMGGTSMATPYVTGAVALIKSVHPDWTASQIIQKVLSSVDKVTSLSGKTVSGGRLNLARAAGASGGDVTGPRVASLESRGASAGPVSGVRVTFSEAIDPATFTAGDVVSFTGPNGSIAVTQVAAVAGSGNTQFDLGFAQQTAPGSYTMVLGPDIRDGSGNRMDQDRDGLSGESTQDRYAGTFAINRLSSFITGGIRINESTTTRVKLTVGSDLTIAKLTVRLTLTHPNLSELTIRLRGPDGTVVLLFNQRGGANADLKATLFDDSASTAIANGQAPFAGTFRPEEPLAAFDGKNARGVWELEIVDRTGGVHGRLNIFTLNVEETPSGGTASAAETSSLPAVTVRTVRGESAAPVNSLVIETKRTEPAASETVRTSAVTAAGEQQAAAAEPFAVRDLVLSLPAHGEQASEELPIERLMEFFEELGR